MNNKDGSYRCTYDPLNDGKHQIHVKAEGKHIKGSPFNLVVTEGVAGGEFSTISFFIQGINRKGEILVPKPGELSVFSLDCKGGTGSVIQDSGEDGRFHFEYKGVKGVNTINVISEASSKSIDGFPLTITV